jgi:deazaflavin-dependent oxidoreductase (nitroreductase family)
MAEPDHPGSNHSGRLSYLPHQPRHADDLSVSFPRWLARANKIGLNQVVKHVAPRLPTLGLIVHRGRKSGRRYETPVMVFRDGNQFLIALTYGGEHTDWVKNVVAAGGCQLRTGGRTYEMGSAHVYQDESRAGIRPLERQVLRLLGAAEFLSLTIAG